MGTEISETCKSHKNKKKNDFKDKIVIEAPIEENNNNINENNNIIENFPDFPEIEEDKYVGNGIKRMKAYKCDITIDILNKKREDFWNTVTNSKSNKYWITWKIIKRAVTYDEVRGPLLLAEYNIKCKNGCINHLIDKNGIEYKIPNYCINEPYFERKLNENIKIENIISLRIYGNYKGELFEFYLRVSDKITGKQLKDIIKSTKNLDNNVNIRIFEQGFEIKDEHILYQLNLYNDLPVHIVINQNLE